MPPGVLLRFAAALSDAVTREVEAAVSGILHVYTRKLRAERIDRELAACREPGLL